MNSFGRFFRLALTLIFVFTMIPAALFPVSPVAASPGWMKFPGNLALNDKYVLDSYVIKDNATYKMWYTRLSFDTSVTQLFNNVKGLALTDMINALQGYDFEGFLNNLADLNTLPTSPSPLWTILNGTRTVIGYAESSDGKNWTNINSNVLPGTSGNFFTSVGNPSVIRIDATHYQMWYTAVQSTLDQTSLEAIFTGMGSPVDATRRTAFNNLLGSTKTVIKYATSINGITGWTPAGTPALSAGSSTPAAWAMLDSVGAPSVILDGSNYKMWYTRLKTNLNGTNLDTILAKVRAGTAHIADLADILNNSALVIGYATSADAGATFTVVNDKVLPGAGIPNPTIWQSAADPCVVKTGTSYEMWYSNGTTNLISTGLATVFNQIRALGIPALWTSLQANDLTTFITDLVSKDLTSLKASLNATSAVIGYATGDGASTWAVQNASDLAGMATTPWSSVAAPSVVKSTTMSEMWYTQGIASLNFQNFLDRVLGVTVSVGYASTKILTLLVVTAPLNSLPVGDSVQFTATGTYNDSTTANLTSAIGTVWNSSNPSVATISATGDALAVGVGSTIITANYGTFPSTNSFALTVTSAQLRGITVTPLTASNPSVPKGKPLQFTAMGNYSDGTNINITNSVTWTSSNTGIATIGANSGLAQSVSVGGPITITATLGISGTSTLRVTSAVYDYLLITPDNPSIADGDTLQLSAIAYNTDGTWTDQTANATWSNDPSGNATVSNTAGTKGLVTTVNASTTATITAVYGSGAYTSGGETDTTLVTVTAARLTAFRILETTPSVAAGLTSASLNLRGDLSDGTLNAVIASNAPGVTWASLTPTIATVSTNGAVTGLVPGTATIRASYLGFTATVSFTVNNPNLTGITVTPAITVVKLGTGNVQYTATGTYTDGIARTIPNAINTTVAWSVTAGATIGATTGLLIPGTAGTVTVTATIAATPYITTLTITTETPSAITITATGGLSVPRGRTRQLIATGTFTGGTANITSLVTWSSGIPANISISASGVVTASGTIASSSVITATYGISGTATVTVAAPELVSITITPVNPSIAKGRTQLFNAAGTYSDNTTNSNITTSVNWTSGTPGVANIGLNTGLTTAAATTGNTVITASFTRPTDSVVITNTTILYVTPAVLTGIAVTSPGGTTVAAGNTLTLVATGTYSDSPPTIVITNNVSWSSSNSAVASVAANGVVTGHSSATTIRITATSGSISNFIDITVTAATISSVTVTPTGAVIAKGTTRQFRAVANYTDGNKVDVTASAAWTSDSALATVGNGDAAGAKGLVTGVNKSPPNPNITATFNAVPGSVSVVITDATLNSITVGPATPSIAAGKQQPFTATASLSDLSTPVITSVVTWSSDNTTVARVNSAGVATSYTPGTANITASYTLLGVTRTDSKPLTVLPAVLDSIIVTPVGPQVAFVSGAGAAPTVQFKAFGVKSDGSTSDITTTVVWSITASAPAGVTNIGAANGTANTLQAGNCTIQARDAATGILKTTTLTVLPDTIAPVVNITSPQEGAQTGNKNITVTGNINDINAATTKQLILNGGAPVTLTPDGNGNFSAGVLLNNGSNTVLVKAIDDEGNIGMSGTVTVKVDAKKPTITLTSPVDGMLTKNPAATVSGTVAVTGTGLMPTLVNVIVNGVTTQANVASTAFSAPATLTPGTNIISVTTYDGGHSGDVDYLGTSGAREVVLDTTAPVVGVNSPVNNSIVGFPSIIVSGTVDDPNISSVRLTLNGGAPVNVTVNDKRFNYEVTLAQGINTISVVATDIAGNSSSATSPTTVTLDTSKPAVTLTSPVNNLLTNSASQQIAGTVSDPWITSVSLVVNGVAESVPAVPGVGFSKIKTFNNGANTIEVRATNQASNIGSSGVFIATVDTTSPSLVLDLTDPTDSVLITVTSNEMLKAIPVVKVNTTDVVMTQSDINKYTGTFALPGPGNYTVTANGTDSAGNTGIAEPVTFSKQSITVSGTAPTPVVSSDTTLQVQTNGAVTGDISVTTELHNPSGNVNNPSGATASAGAFVQIVASPELLNNLKEIYIRVNYDPAQLPSGTDETTLKLYLWDVTSGTWQVVPGSGVNTTEHYIYGTVTHLSTYGGFAAAVPVTPPIIFPPPGPVAGTTVVTSSVLPSGQFTVEVIARSDDSLCSVTIPMSTIGRTINGSALSSLVIQRMILPPAAPTNNQIVGAVYSIGPDGATFSPAITITIPYTDAQVPAGADVNKMAIHFRDSTGNWIKLTSVVNTTAHTVTAQTTHFTSFTILVPTAPAIFTASSLTAAPSEVKTGELITISVKITNSGDLSGTYKATLKVNNETVETKDVVIAGGVSSTLTFTTSKTTAGTYSISVDNQTGQFIVKEAVVIPTTTPTTTPPSIPASFTISNLTVTPATVDVNGNVTISVQVSNSGDASGAYEVKLKIDNTVAQSKTVTVAGKSSQTVTFTASKAQAGTYTVGIEGLTSFFTVKVPATTPTTTPPVKPTGANWALIGGIIGGIVVIAAVLVVVMMIRRKK